VTGSPVTRFRFPPFSMPAPTPSAGVPRHGSSRPGLARELLWNLVLLMTAALSLAVATGLIAQSLDAPYAIAVLLALIAADLIVLVLFGRYLIGRLVLRPMRGLMEAADRVGAGDLDVRAAPAETAEFTRLAERLNDMTDALLDARGQLVQAEKLAGIGRLAAGIAHEVGNPLAAIGTYLEVLRKGPADPEVVTALRAEVDRIDGIVRGLLTYARPVGGDRGVVAPGAVVDRVVDLLEQQGVLKGRELTRDVASDLPPVRGRPQALEQVLVNLLLNALDAAPTGPVHVAAVAWAYAPGPSRGSRRTDAGAEPPVRRMTRTPRRPDLAPGTPGVLLLVADAGSGVPEAERDRIFDPFYTTKPPGAGTGLGLAIVQRLVHEMGGLVWVEDGRGGGAAFKVFLPLDGTDRP